jgi:hypothetical protein
MPAQPQDEWTYLRPEEFADDDAVERIDATFESSAEETAVHEVDPDAGTGANASLDPGETVVRPQSDDDVLIQYFDDEEPDRHTGRVAAESDDEPGIDELLVSQHYTFDPDGQ